MRKFSFDFRSEFKPGPGLAQVLSRHPAGCGCLVHARRRWALACGMMVATPLAWADGVQVDERSLAANLIPAQEVESMASQQYAQMLREASRQRALAPDSHPQVVRLRAISERLIPYIGSPNLQSTPRAKQWKWEVNLIGSKQVNAFCMPGGKIAFFTGILEQLQLTDDEVAQVMGHEIAHALREHARERMGKTAATRGLIDLGATILGLGGAGRMVADMGGNLLTLKFGRDDESEADKIGLDLAARAGYNPRAGISLWQKMTGANRGAPPQWLSTHPSGNTRIKEMETNLPAVEPLYARAERPRQVFGPPSGASGS